MSSSVVTFLKIPYAITSALSKILRDTSTAARSLRSSAHSRVPSRVIPEAEVIVWFRYVSSGGPAVFLHQDTQEGLERRRDSLPEKELPPPYDPQSGRSRATHRCRAYSFPSHSADDALRYRPALC